MFQEAKNYSGGRHPKNTFYPSVTFEAKHGQKIFAGNRDGLPERQIQPMLRIPVKLRHLRKSS